jgi:hypothetical protein
MASPVARIELSVVPELPRMLSVQLALALLVKYRTLWVKASKATVPVAAVAATVVRSSGDTRTLVEFVPPVIVGVAIVAVLIVGLVKVLLVRISVVALPTKVSLLVGGRVSVLVPATAVACTVVVPDVDPLKAKDATGDALLRKKIKSSDVNTCLTVAPAL